MAIGDVQLGNALITAQAANWITAATGGTVEIRTGAKPANCEATATGTLVVTCTVTGAPTQTNGAITYLLAASTIQSPGVSSITDGTAVHARFKTSGGVAFMDLLCGPSGSYPMNVGSSLPAGQSWPVSGTFTHTVSKATG
jgi:hypothetical protein